MYFWTSTKRGNYICFTFISEAAKIFGLKYLNFGFPSLFFEILVEISFGVFKPMQATTCFRPPKQTSDFSHF